MKTKEKYRAAKGLHLVWNAAVLTTILALVWISWPYAVSAWQVEQAASEQSEGKATTPRLQAALQAEPGNVQALRQLARLYLETDQPTKALTAAKQAAGLMPHNPLIQLELGDVYDRLGQPAQAIAHYEAGLVGNRGPQLTVNYLQQADQLWTAGDEEAAVAIWRDKVRGNGYGDLYANWRLARYYADDMEAAAPYREAVRYFSLESIAPPLDPRLTTYQAQAILGVVEDGLWPQETLLNVVSYRVWQDQTARAEELLQALTAAHPDDTDLRFYLGELYQRRGEWIQAEAAYRQVLDLDPNYAQAYLRLGLVAEERQFLHEAALWYEQYYNIVPQDLLALKRLVTTYEILDDERVKELKQKLDTTTGTRQIVSDFLQVPLRDVTIEHNIIDNRSYELLERNNQPRKWIWFPTGGLFFGGTEKKFGYSDNNSIRIDGFWTQIDNNDRAGYWNNRLLKPPNREILLLSFLYRTDRLETGEAKIQIHGKHKVITSQQLPATNGSWEKAILVFLNPTSNSVRSKNSILFRSFGAGSLFIDNIELRAINVREKVKLKNPLIFLISE